MTAVAINRSYTNATTERLREELQKRDQALTNAEERTVALKTALKPFAEVMGWIDHCQEQDRNIRLGTTFVDAATGAFSSRYAISAEDFERAAKAMRR